LRVVLERREGKMEQNLPKEAKYNEEYVSTILRKKQSMIM